MPHTAWTPCPHVSKSLVPAGILTQSNKLTPVLSCLPLHCTRFDTLCPGPLCPCSTPILAVRADVGRLPFATGSVDAIHAGAAIHCWPNPQAAMAEISRVLKPGGIFVASTFLTPFAPLGELVGDATIRPISQVREGGDGEMCECVLSGGSGLDHVGGRSLKTGRGANDTSYHAWHGACGCVRVGEECGWICRWWQRHTWGYMWSCGLRVLAMLVPGLCRIVVLAKERGLGSISVQQVFLTAQRRFYSSDCQVRLASCVRQHTNQPGVLRQIGVVLCVAHPPSPLLQQAQSRSSRYRLWEEQELIDLAGSVGLEGYMRIRSFRYIMFTARKPQGTLL